MPSLPPKRAGDFPSLVQRFFAGYLDSQRGLSVHTRAGYRNAFRLLLVFLGNRHRCPVDRITLSLLDPESVLAFLDHLERERGNCARTRNLRLAAIRSFARFVIGAGCVEYFETAHRILAMPAKRTARSTPAFMTREEVDAVLRAVDSRTWSGRRDLLLFTLLYNTGARIGEALQLRARDVRGRVVHLHGKGRKDRDVPLWPQTTRLMKRWCVENNTGPDQLVFTNRWGEPLSHDGASHRLDIAVKKAVRECPSLNGKRITAHRFRNSCAMALLQAGVPLEIIALYLGHARPITTHGYIEADLKMKADTLRRLDEPHLPKRRRGNEQSNLLSFLEAVL